MKSQTTIISKSEKYSIVAVGKNKLEISEKLKKEFDKLVKLLEEEFNQRVFSIYFNEDRTRENELHGVNFVFFKENPNEDSTDF